MIHPNLVLTAAHCYTDDRLVAFERVYLNGDGIGNKKEDFKEHFKVKQWILHPDFGGSRLLTNDIAIIVLDGQSAVKPVQLAKKPVANGEKITAVGWGRNETDEPSEKLMYLTLNVDSNACPKLKEKNFKGIVCVDLPVVGPGKNASTCSGDSGRFCILIEI